MGSDDESSTNSLIESCSTVRIVANSENITYDVNLGEEDNIERIRGGKTPERRAPGPTTYFTPSNKIVWGNSKVG